MNNNGSAKLTLGRFLNNKDAQKHIVQNFPLNSTSSEDTDRLSHNSSVLNQQNSTKDAASPTLRYEPPDTATPIVRLSDNEISEILSLPIALVSDNPYSTTPTLLSGSTTSSNVATPTTVSDSSIISPNNENNQFVNIVGYDNKMEKSSPSNTRGHIDSSRCGLNDRLNEMLKQHQSNNNSIKSEPGCDNSSDFMNPLQNVVGLNKET